MPEIDPSAECALQGSLLSADREAMNDSLLNPDSISIPRWTIKQDMWSLGCIFCRSIFVYVATETKQMAFCSCRLVAYRLLPKPSEHVTEGDNC